MKAFLVIASEKPRTATERIPTASSQCVRMNGAFSQLLS